MKKVVSVAAGLTAVFAGAFPMQAASDNGLAETVAGEYWSVEDDRVYGIFQQDCSIRLEDDGRISLNDFPVLECYKVFGNVVEEGDKVVLRFANGQNVWKNSYGNKYYFWVAAPDDPTYGYTVDIDEFIDFQVDSETGVISWEAPMTEARDAWLRFMMVGSYYFDYDTNIFKVSGSYHYIDVKLYPVNALFTATRVDGSDAGIEPDIRNKVKAELKGDKLLVSGLLHINHGVAVAFDIDRESRKVSVPGMSEMGVLEEEGMVYMAPFGDEHAAIVGNVEITEEGSVITLDDFYAFNEDGLSAGEYTDCKLTVPFDIFEGMSGVAPFVSEDSDAEVEYFNMQGQRIAAPSDGIFLRRQGSKVERIVVL